MTQLLETIAAGLEKPRVLLPQVIKHLVGTYGLERDALGAFLVEKLPGLEDYEIDLILSPLFTPTLAEQAVFAELLGRESIPSGQWPGLVQQLAARPTRAPILVADGETHLVALREVTIERFVHRLRLDATMPEPLFALLNSLPPFAGRSLLKAVARRAIWESEPRRQILIRALAPVGGGGDERLEDVIALLKLAETYEPRDAADLLARIPPWQQTLRHEINSVASPKPFFNERVEELHGGGRDQRRTDDGRRQSRERESAFLDRLTALLGG